VRSPNRIIISTGAQRSEEICGFQVQRYGSNGQFLNRTILKRYTSAAKAAPVRRTFSARLEAVPFVKDFFRNLFSR
jgi:hypothetical protein